MQKATQYFVDKFSSPSEFSCIGSFVADDYLACLDLTQCDDIDVYTR